MIQQGSDLWCFGEPEYREPTDAEKKERAGKYVRSRVEEARNSAKAAIEQTGRYDYRKEEALLEKASTFFDELEAATDETFVTGEDETRKERTCWQ